MIFASILFPGGIDMSIALQEPTCYKVAIMNNCGDFVTLNICSTYSEAEIIKD